MTVEDVSILIILQKLIDRNCSQDLYFGSARKVWSLQILSLEKK